MSSSFGQKLKITIFGQSHSDAIGVVLDGLPVGEYIDINEVLNFMARRAPGGSPLATSRKEADLPEILSGIINGKTCGAPLCAIIKNTNTRSDDYDNLRDTPRPSHSDYPAYVKYKGYNDISGGGHFSGRLTAPLCFAGAVCKQILSRKGINVGAHISSLAGIDDASFDSLSVTADLLKGVSSRAFPVINEGIEDSMKAEIISAKNSTDSVGGIIECCIIGIPAGIGEPMFDGVENRISSIIFGIPAVRGIEFGAGFSAASLKGSEHNDPYYYDEIGEVKTKTNNHGGIIGGITSGMPIIFRAALKPTPSIAREQDSINLSTKTNTKLIINGRHDPCIVLRAVPCVEAAAAIAILDLLL